MKDGQIASSFGDPRAGKSSQISSGLFQTGSFPDDSLFSQWYSSGTGHRNGEPESEMIDMRRGRAPRGAGPACAGGGGLLRVLGIAFGLAVIIGNTIGMGILRTPGEIAARLPSTPLFLGVWAAGGLYALLGALSLSELGAMIPQSGGQYVFVRRALGAYPGFIVGWSDWISNCGTMAAVSIVLGEYIQPLVPALAGRERWTAGAVVIGFALLQWRGVRVGDRTQQLTSLLKMLALLGLVIAILVVPQTLAPAAPMPRRIPVGFAFLAALVAAFQAAIYTYDGWTGAIYFGEEVKNPGRDIPRSTVGGVLLVLVIYLSLNIAFLHAVPIGRMAGDPFVAANAAVAVFGPHGDTILRILMILSMLAAMNAYQMMASRVPVAMSRDRMLPEMFGRINAGGTPAGSLAAGTLVALLFILTNTFDTVLALLAFFFVANYVLSFTSVFVLRRKEPDADRPYRAFGFPWTTGAALAGSVAFLIAAGFSDRTNSLRAALLLAASYPVFLAIRGKARVGAG
jgi:APA family basic amino acid/polyamine antiporter